MDRVGDGATIVKDRRRARRRFEKRLARIAEDARGRFIAGDAVLRSDEVKKALDEGKHRADIDHSDEMLRNQAAEY